MYCLKCGKKLKDGEKFCQNCGTKIQAVSPKMTPEQSANKIPKAIEPKSATMSSFVSSSPIAKTPVIKKAKVNMFTIFAIAFYFLALVLPIGSVVYTNIIKGSIDLVELKEESQSSEEPQKEMESEVETEAETEIETLDNK